MHYSVLIHEDGGKITSQVFKRKQEGRAAMRELTSGVASLFELNRSHAAKRANFETTHGQSKDSLENRTEKQLRAEAKKRNLSIAGNPQAARHHLISEIQQDELTKRLAHRRPLSSDHQQLNAEGTDAS